MSALRTLGFCYLAAVSVFGLAIVAADQVRLREVLDTATETVSEQIDQSVMRPLLAFARTHDETFFDPAPGTKTIALASPELNEERTYAHFNVLLAGLASARARAVFIYRHRMQRFFLE